MTQPFLKPGVFWPLPVGLGKIVDVIKTIVHSTLQKDDLPVAQFVCINLKFWRRRIHAIVNAT
jgi:hypothetical protein